jgi:hypothetical protein
MKLFSTLLLLTSCALAADPPTYDMTYGNVHAKLYLPDTTNGYYQATRFDWAGVVASMEWKGHQYFGKWFDRYDPKINDAITGPVEEFAPVGYDEAAVGEAFVKIGVGALRKPQENAYRQFNTYEIANNGFWLIITHKDHIDFEQTLSDTNGYAYEYVKTLTVHADGFTIDHQLRNTGRKTIATSVYEHNFFMLDGKPSGPDLTVKLPFAPRAVADLRGLAEIRGNQIAYLKELQPRETILTDIVGFSDKVSDYDIRVENRATGAGVRQTSDHPMSKLAFWSIRNTACPEAYVDLRIEPGKDVSWRIHYDFYEVALYQVAQ